MVVLLGELHLPHVKMSYAVYLVMLVYHCRRLPLCFGQSDVDEILQKGGKADRSGSQRPPFYVIHSNNKTITLTRQTFPLHSFFISKKCVQL